MPITIKRHDDDALASELQSVQDGIAADTVTRDDGQDRTVAALLAWLQSDLDAEPVDPPPAIHPPPV